MDKNLAALLLRGCREMQPASRFSAEREKEGGKDLVSVGKWAEPNGVSPATAGAEIHYPQQDDIRHDLQGCRVTCGRNGETPKAFYV